MSSFQITPTPAPADLDILMKHITVVRNEQNCPITRENSMKALRNNANVGIVAEFLATVNAREKLAALKNKPIK